ncbi:MAG: RNA 2',3'-cyclic phosphodiesterase, partial [Acidobacteriota bacterium]|nr:RNA 2',3'-cyclic phosphodiesterase [Acidobacteriota bacterium]
MRCFLALEVPEPVREDIGRRLESLRGDFPPARWVPPSNYHLTLLFLGELGASQVERLGAKLAPVFGAASTMRVS